MSTVFANNSIICTDGLILPCWRPLDNLRSTDRIGRGFVYFIALVYLFIGVSIISDRFMASIEVITSRKVLVNKPKGNTSAVVVKLWNNTVANLTLMALGSSAPEILLSVIEIYCKGYEAGALGPGTAVGSAAFNLFVITGVCIIAIPNGEVKKIERLDVFLVTSVWSVFAYVWLYIILAVSSPGTIEVWEALLTVVFFPLMVVNAYAVDKRMCRKTEEVYSLTVLTEDEGKVKLGNSELLALGDIHEEIKQEYLTILKELRLQHPRANLLALERMVHETVLKSIPKSRAFYMIQATRKLIGIGDLFRRISEIAQRDLEEIRAELEREARLMAPSIYFEPNSYTVLESCGQLDVRITREGNLDTPLTVDYTTEDGTAQADSKYIPIKGSLHFLSGDKEKHLNIQVIDDDVFGDDEHFYIRLLSEESRFLGTPTFATIIILDDDCGGVFKFESANYELEESVGTFHLKVLRCSKARGKVVVPYWTEDGTARAGKEYAANAGELVFESNESE